MNKREADVVGKTASRTGTAGTKSANAQAKQNYRTPKAPTTGMMKTTGRVSTTPTKVEKPSTRKTPSGYALNAAPLSRRK